MWGTIEKTLQVIEDASGAMPSCGANFSLRRTSDRHRQKGHDLAVEGLSPGVFISFRGPQAHPVQVVNLVS